MSKIVFLVDFEYGHIIPTVSLARNLLNMGHKVSYAGIPDIRNYIQELGFEYLPILQEDFPAGCLEKIRKEWKNSKTRNPYFTPNKHIQTFINGRGLDHVLNEKPDILVIISFLTLETLIIQLLYDIPIVFFTPFLRPLDEPLSERANGQIADLSTEAFQIYELALKKKINCQSIAELTSPLDAIPEIICCPANLELPEKLRKKANVFHINPSLNRNTGLTHEEFHWPPHVLENLITKPIIYISLGSQTGEYLDKAQDVFKRIFRTISSGELDNYYFIVSLGQHLKQIEFGDLPGNVSLFNWVPQDEILKHCALMITHGGLGTIKECIFHNVPMIVVPLVTDAFDNAKRVNYHNLGLKMDIVELTDQQLITNIDKVHNDGSIKKSLIKMQQAFETVDQQLGVQVITQSIQS